MRLVEARIEGFGQYRDQVISFASGLNIIHGTNESGKTTLMKFIEGVLYGFYKPSQRRQYTEDYEKYRPWDGGPYAGTLIYENAGRTIAVYRDFAGEEIRMYDWETKEDLTGQLTYNGVIRQVDPASRDWKISPAAFRNTISIVQGKACPDLEQIGGELQESLMNLTTAGDEDISVRTSLRTLRRQMEEIEGDGASGGTLNELAARENELKERLRQSRELQRRQERIRAELAELPEEAEDPEQADLLVERAGRPEQKGHLQQMEQEIAKLREQERQIRSGAQGNEKQYEELIGLQKEVSGLRVRQADAQLRTEQCEKALAALPEESKPQEENADKDAVLTAAAAIGGVLTVAAVLLGIFVSPWCMVLVLGGGAAELYAFMRYQKRMQEGFRIRQEKRAQADTLRMEREKAQERLKEAKTDQKSCEEALERGTGQLQEILQRTGVSSVEEYGSRLRSQARQETLRDRLDHLEREQSRWKMTYAAEILRERRALLSRRLEESLQEEDTAALREELAQVVQQKDRLTMERDSLRAAAAAIESLSREVQKEYEPVLTENMKKTVENITAGRYNTVYVSDQEGIRAQSADGREVAMDQLSAGTGDQIYFAVRLGMIDLLSPKVKLPLILDDAFARYDDERLGKILRLLRQEAKNRQILIFTCQKREKELLTAMRAAFQYNELKG